MTSAVSKKELRRNPLAALVGEAIRFARAQRTAILAVVALLALASAGGAGYWWYEKHREEIAGRALAEAEDLLRGDKPGSPGKPDEAMQHLRAVATQYRGTPSGEEALVRLGNLQYDGGKPDEARATFDEYLSAYPRGRFLVMAGLGKAYAQEAKGDFQGAAQTLSDIVGKAKDDPLAGEAYTSLARVYEELKKPDEAVRIYGQIAEKYSQTQWAQHALQRMSDLKPK